RRYFSQNRHQSHDRVARTVAARTRSYDLLLFGIIDWHFHLQRPQQLCRQFAAMGYRVFYVEPSFHSTCDPRLLERGYSLVESPEPNIYLCQLHDELARPDFYRSPMELERQESFARGMENLRREHQAPQVVSL